MECGLFVRCARIEARAGGTGRRTHPALANVDSANVVGACRSPPARQGVPAPLRRQRSRLAQWYRSGLERRGYRRFARACSRRSTEALCATRAQMTFTGVAIDWAPACALDAAVAHQATFRWERRSRAPVLASVLDAGHAVWALIWYWYRFSVAATLANLVVQVDPTVIGPGKPKTRDVLGTFGPPSDPPCRSDLPEARLRSGNGRES